MNYDDITLEVSELTTRTDEDRRLGTFKVRVLQSPRGEMRPDQAISVEYNDKDLQSSLAKLDRRELDAAGLIAVGRTLAALLLPVDAQGNAPSVRELFARSIEKVGPDGGLRLRLRLPADLAVIPWEYAYVERAGGEGMDGFLALDPRIAIVRHEVLAATVTAPLLSGDIKVVAALAGAEGLPELDLDGEMKFLDKALRGLEGIQLQPCQHATLKKLQPLLAGAGVFHFAGHGDFTRKMGARPGTYTGIGYLAFEDERVDAEQMGMNLRGQGVRLAVLSGCHTGRRDGISVWSGIAPALVKAEIPAVVANQYTILDKCAIAFSHQFYLALAGGLPIERAVSAGRIAAYNADKGGRDWGVPVLYLRSADGQLFVGAADPQARERTRQAAEGDTVQGQQVNIASGGQASVYTGISGPVTGPVTIIQLGVERIANNKAKTDVGRIIEECRSVLTDLADEITLLDGYKRLHDQLQLALMQYSNLAKLATDIGTGQNAPEDLANSLAMFMILVHSIAQVIKDLPAKPASIRQEEEEWSNRFQAAAIRVSEAADSRDHEACLGGVLGIKIILRQWPSRINAKLVLTAKGLHLSQLKELFAKVANLPKSEVDQCIFLTDGQNACSQLEEKLMADVNQHSNWQEVDCRLDMADEELRRSYDQPLTSKPVDLSNFDALWKDIKKEAISLMNNSPGAEWVTRLTNSIGHVDSARDILDLSREMLGLSPNNKDFGKLTEAFSTFRREATYRFFTVDSELKELAGQVNSIGAPLRKLAAP